MTTPVLKKWHSPRNELCEQNLNPDYPCTCKRPPVARKPYRTCRVIDRDPPRGIKPQIVMEVHPDGQLVLRQKGSPRRYRTTVGKVFNGIIWNEAMATLRAKMAAKKNKGKGRSK